MNPRTFARKAVRRGRSDLQALRTPSSRQAVRKAYLHGGLRRVVPLIGTETEQGILFSRTNDRVIGRQLYAHGSWDSAGLSQALDAIGMDLRGKTMIEVGANIGTTTVQAVRAGAAHVWAFEPEPTNYRLLRANLAVNLLDDRVTTVLAGCSSTNGGARMSLSDSNSGDHRVSVDGDVPIELVTLDSYMASVDLDPTKVDLVWLDTQGHEPEVLRGATELLAAGPPLVLEFWPEMIRSRWAEFVESLSGYSRFFDLGTNRPVDDLGAAADTYVDRWTNLVALP